MTTSFSYLAYTMALLAGLVPAWPHLAQPDLQGAPPAVISAEAARQTLLLGRRQLHQILQDTAGCEALQTLSGLETQGHGCLPLEGSPPPAQRHPPGQHPSRSNAGQATVLMYVLMICGLVSEAVF